MEKNIEIKLKLKQLLDSSVSSETHTEIIMKFTTLKDPFADNLNENYVLYREEYAKGISEYTVLEPAILDKKPFLGEYPSVKIKEFGGKATVSILPRYVLYDIQTIKSEGIEISTSEDGLLMAKVQRACLSPNDSLVGSSFHIAFSVLAIKTEFTEDSFIYHFASYVPAQVIMDVFNKTTKK